MDKNTLEHLTHGAALIGRGADPVAHLLLASAVARGASVPAEALGRLGQQVRGCTSMRELTGVLCGETARAIGLDRRVADAIAAGRLVPTGTRFLERIPLAGPSLAEEAGAQWARFGLAGSTALAPLGDLLGIDLADPANGAGAVLSAATADFSLAGFLQAAQAGDAARLETLALPLLAELELRLRVQLGAVPRQTSFDALAERLAAPDDPAPPAARALQSGAVALRVLARYLPPDLRRRAEEIGGYVQGAVQAVEAVQLILAAGSGWGAALAIAGLAGGLGNMRLPGMGADAAAAARHEQLMQAIQDLLREMRQEFAKVNTKLDSMMSTLEDIVAMLRTQAATLSVLQKQLDALARDIDLVQLGIYRVQYAIEAGTAADTHHEFSGIIALEGETPFATDQQFLHALEFYARYAHASALAPAQPAPDGQDDAERLANARQLVLAAILASSQPVDRWLALNALTHVLESEYGCPEFGPTVHEPQLRFALHNFAGTRLADPARFQALSGRPAGKALVSRHLDGMRRLIAGHDGVMANLRSAREQDDFRRGTPFWVLLGHYKLALDALAAFDLHPLVARVFDDHLDELAQPGAVGRGQERVELDIFAGHPDKRGLAVEVFGTGHTTGPHCAVAPLYTTIWTDPAGNRTTTPLSVGLYGMHVVTIDPADEGLKSHYVNFDTEVRLLNQPIARFTMQLKLHHGGVRRQDPAARAQYVDQLRYMHEPFMRIALAEAYWYVPSGKEGIAPEVLNKALLTDACRNNAKALLRRAVPLASWEGRQSSLGRALAQGQSYDWRDAREAARGLREQVARLQGITHMVQAVCMVGYGPLYDQADVLRALLEGDAATRVIDDDVLQAWGRAVSGAGDAVAARLAGGIDLGEVTDHQRTRYRSFAELARQRYAQLRKALLLLSEQGEQAGPFFAFHQVRTHFEQTFGAELDEL